MKCSTVRVRIHVLTYRIQSSYQNILAMLESSTNFITPDVNTPDTHCLITQHSNNNAHGFRIKSFNSSTFGMRYVPKMTGTSFHLQADPSNIKNASLGISPVALCLWQQALPRTASFVTLVEAGEVICIAATATVDETLTRPEGGVVEKAIEIAGAHASIRWQQASRICEHGPHKVGDLGNGQKIVAVFAYLLRSSIISRSIRENAGQFTLSSRVVFILVPVAASEVESLTSAFCDVESPQWNASTAGPTISCWLALGFKITECCNSRSKHEGQ